MKPNKRTEENICKLVYLAQQYPEKNIVQLSQMFQTSPIDFNVAAWLAQDLGYLEVAKDNTIKLLKTPEKENFGEMIAHLLEVIPFALAKINKEEADIEENYFSNWTAGYPAQDIFVALKKLINDGKIASYEITNKTEIKPNREQRRAGAKEETITDTYTFYTLPENADKQWGRKQFEDPEKLEK